MKIGCPQCHAAFSLDDKRVSATGLTVKCPKCAQAFTVHRPAPGDEDKLVVGRPASQPAAPRPHGAIPSGPTLIDGRPPATMPDNASRYAPTKQELPAFGAAEGPVESAEAAKESE